MNSENKKQMKTLYLIRHAKSDWANITLADIDRPLNTRGYTDAHTMSELAKSKKMVPDEIITSPAIRAITTALIFARNCNFNASRIRIEPLLYHSNTQNYLDIISETNSKTEVLFLFAHNPVISDCANSLLKTKMDEMPTCGIVGITSNCDDWETFVNADCKLILFDFPNNH